MLLNKKSAINIPSGEWGNASIYTLCYNEYLSKYSTLETPPVVIEILHSEKALIF